MTSRKYPVIHGGVTSCNGGFRPPFRIRLRVVFPLRSSPYPRTLLFRGGAFGKAASHFPKGTSGTNLQPQMFGERFSSPFLTLFSGSPRGLPILLSAQRARPPVRILRATASTSGALRTCRQCPDHQQSAERLTSSTRHQQSTRRTHRRRQSWRPGAHGRWRYFQSGSVSQLLLERGADRSASALAMWHIRT